MLRFVEIVEIVEVVSIHRRSHESDHRHYVLFRFVEIVEIVEVVSIHRRSHESTDTVYCSDLLRLLRLRRLFSTEASEDVSCMYVCVHMNLRTLHIHITYIHT